MMNLSIEVFISLLVKLYFLTTSLILFYGPRSVGWSENNFFFEIEKSVVLKTCQTGKIYKKNWFWRVATFGGLATPQNVF